MATVEQRVSYIEGRLDSLATKEDLARLEARLTWRILWAQALGATAMATVVTAAVAIMRFLS